MQLDDIQAVIRPRSAWEATDLGMLMAVRWWRPMLKPWLVITLPAYLLLLLVPGENWIGPALFWWLKPLWERIHLHIVSRALFGEVPTVRQTLRAFPKLLLPRLFPALLWGRLNAYRSMDAPVMQLEGLRGAKYRQRIRLLHAEDEAPGPYLIMAGAAMETIIYFAAVVLVSLLIPTELDGTLSQTLTAADGTFMLILNYVLWYTTVTLVAPFYVAGGFGLYLNRRVKLEAWDIEIAFRKLAAARTHTAAPLARVALIVLALALPLAGTDSPAYAAEPADAATQELEAARALAADVMARDEFHVREIRQTPEMDPELAEAIMRWLDRLLDWLDAEDRPGGSLLFAQLIEVLLWAALLALVAIVLWHYRAWLRAFTRHGRPASAAVTTTHAAMPAAHIDPRNAALPADVAAECKALWQRGEKLEAVALLYRASLVVFMRAYRCEFAESATEGDHLARVRATVSPAASAWFTGLSRTWLFIAYGKRAPDDAELLALCDSWHRDWQQAVQGQAAGGVAR